MPPDREHSRNPRLYQPGKSDDEILLRCQQRAHGYVRARDSKITIFDAPGAGTGAGQGTFATGIDPAARSQVCTSTPPMFHTALSALLTARSSRSTSRSGNGLRAGYFPGVHWHPGDIVGRYVDASGVSHGFLRSQSGHVLTFDVPGAGSASGLGTVPGSSDPAARNHGILWGQPGDLSHGFLHVINE